MLGLVKHLLWPLPSLSFRSLPRGSSRAMSGQTAFALVRAGGVAAGVPPWLESAALQQERVRVRRAAAGGGRRGRFLDVDYPWPRQPRHLLPRCPISFVQECERNEKATRPIMPAATQWQTKALVPEDVAAARSGQRRPTWVHYRPHSVTQVVSFNVGRGSGRLREE